MTKKDYYRTMAIYWNNQQDDEMFDYYLLKYHEYKMRESMVEFYEKQLDRLNWLSMMDNKEDEFYFG